jgi:hypothetical protein
VLFTQLSLALSLFRLLVLFSGIYFSRIILWILYRILVNMRYSMSKLNGKNDDVSFDFPVFLLKSRLYPVIFFPFKKANKLVVFSMAQGVEV